MSDLKVGDVCKDWDRLRAGMLIRFDDSIGGPGQQALLTHVEDDTWRSARAWFVPEYVNHYGVTILALPEEAPKLGENVVIGFGDLPQPAMPPARCAPGCTQARACRITIPVTDKGTRYECPAFAEDKASNQTSAQDTGRRIYWRDNGTDDARESRAMRGQRWEPATNGLGAFPGRYRFDRRPR